MPQPGVQLVLLLLAVPAQYLISKWMAPQFNDREYITKRFFADGIDILRKLCNTTEWKNYINEIKDHVLYSALNGECPAKEVMKFNEPNGYFSGSPESRTNRKNIKFKVGQVIKHKKFGYRGVIIGWDSQARAPDYWLQVNHFDPSWRYQPNYSVLVHGNDRTDYQTTYVVEENMEEILDTQISHPDIEEYFEKFDGDRYVARPWLKELYPND